MNDHEMIDYIKGAENLGFEIFDSGYAKCHHRIKIEFGRAWQWYDLGGDKK